MSAVALKTVDLSGLTNLVLARFATELHDAGPEQLEHLARRAECYCRTRLGERMRALVDDERARRVFTVALMPLPPADNQPQAGPRRPDGLPERVPLIFAAVERRFPQPPHRGDRGLGFQFWAVRQQRWEQAGRVGDPSDPEYDDVFHTGGEGGS